MMDSEEKNATDLLDDYQEQGEDEVFEDGDGMGDYENDTPPNDEDSDIQSISENSDSENPPRSKGIEPQEGFDPTGLQGLAPSAVELLDDPMIRRGGERLMDGDTMEPPFDQAFSVLTVTGGPKLQMMSRMTPPLARAVDQAFNLISNYKSRYISDHSDLYLRLNVSRDGQGRREIVESLNAGSGMSPEFYQSGPTKSTTKQAFIDPEE